jgi:hypothetical protein
VAAPPARPAAKVLKKVVPRQRRAGGARRDKDAALLGNPSPHSSNARIAAHKRDKLRLRVLEEIVATERTYLTRLEVGGMGCACAHRL